MNRSTNADPASTGWAIHDQVIRLRELGSERVFDLEGATHWVLGSSAECSIQLDDRSGRISRRHAALSRDGDTWTVQDLASTNGTRQNREVRRSFQLTPCDEIELGGITLIAESHHSIELHGLLRRWLGWSRLRLDEVDRALREVREMANLRTALILRGEGSLVGISRQLHRSTLGDRPFATLAPGESGLDGLQRAANGMLCVDARCLPEDLQLMIAGLRMPEARVRLVACADSSGSISDLSATIPRVATIWIPALAEREHELDRLIEAYGYDAMNALGADTLGFRPYDLKWVRASGLKTLEEVEDVARRLVALRNWGVSGGARRLGITHVALSRWASRRKIPT